MNIDIETSIRYPDGEVAGTIEKVVFDPESGEVHEIVMATPGFLGRRVIVPVALLRADPGDVMTLVADRDSVDALPDYEVDRYMTPPEGWEVSQNYAPGASVFPATFYYPTAPITEESNIPEGSVEISQGTAVICTDGRFGIVDEVVLAEESNQLVAFIARPDDEFAVDIEVPLELVESADSLAVRLSCTKAELPSLGTPLEHELEEPEPREVI